MSWTRSDMQCLISWIPVIEGNRVFTVRQTYASAPYNPPAGDSRVHCLDLATGATIWTFDCPFEAGDWSTVVYGASGGRVYAFRDTGTGFELLWTAPSYTEPGARHAITPDGGVTMLSRWQAAGA